jgi:hypothetical protein
MMFKDRMYELGLKYGTDKISLHRYHETYPLYLERFQNYSGSMIEVGLLEGSSLNMWLNLFPNMHIYGLDINPEKFINKGERYTILKADQSKEEDLIRVAQEIKGPINFICDDGSHIPEHQLLTFNKLFPLLEVGGVYIIEDIETSYWSSGGLYGYKTAYGVGHPNSIVELFKATADGVNYLYSDMTHGPIKHQEYFHSVTFARNSIIITKRSKETGDYAYKKFTSRK